ncbi:SGNH/GDSL hydrolase family protein [Phytohabitans sp. ZYX-F-186]|uniref:SGNH/GDSL hydrolase family protein n=1 Tax=Phytohabitans maris TaxID=3071409 RepID=A0ABU0ZF69_9ACTN|nr:GDSL-type esterase/lipase family protein [Phytohabitans sp. ZYX-F-186]MDQ7905701.1 SGNH/GDSL hydrolase family protein [Phytohabitans sp. ZYX-F-186]
MRVIQLGPDAPGVWRGSLAWTEEDGAWQPWRLPPERVETAHAPDLVARARMAAGIRAAVQTDATALELRVIALDGEVAPLDVVVDGVLWRREPLAAGATDRRVPLPPGRKVVEVWLPQFGEARIGPLLLHGATAAEPAGADGEVRWVTYGSSITQCRTASGPSETWPALVARHLGWDLTCLGFSGECHLDPIAARAIAERPADLISLCLGINVYGRGSFGPRTLAGQVSGFVQTIRDAHPAVPIVVISPISSPSRETLPNPAAMTLEDVRDAVAAAVTTLRRRGDALLHLVDGPSVLGPDHAHLLPDGLHPDADGYRLMAERLAPRLAAIRSTPTKERTCRDLGTTPAG